MAIFGRSFPFPQTRVHKLVGPASTVRATIIRPVRLADRTRSFPHVTIKTRVGPASTVKPQYVHARLPDRPRPFPHVTINKQVGPRSTVRATYVHPVRLPDSPRPKRGVLIRTALAQTTNVTLTAAQGSYILTGEAAAFINSQFGGLVRIRLPDRPRPFPHVTIKTPVPVVINTTLTASTGNYTLTGEDAQFIFGRFASPPVMAVRLADRPRPFPHVFISKAPPPPVIAGTLTASTGFYTLTGENAAFAQSQFGLLAKPVRLADRPRPFPHVTIKTRIPAVSNTTLLASTGTYVLTGADAQFITTRFASAPVKARLPDRPRPFPHVTVKTRLPVAATTMAANTGFYVLSGKDAGFPDAALPPPSGFLQWNLERAGWPHKRRKPTLLEILADIIEEDPPPKLAEKLSRRKKAKARAEAQQWAEEIVERAQRQAESYELEYAKATIAAALKEHAKSLIDAAIERRLDQEEEEAILLLLSHYH